KHAHPDVFILDDGFQHLRVRRSLNILILDSINPFGNGRVFPAGSLREPVSAMKRADAVILSRTEDPEDVRELRRWISDRYPNIPVFSARYRPAALVSLASGETEKLESLRGEKIMAVLGIGNPDRFTGMLRRLGGHLESMAVYPDHFSYRSEDIRFLEKEGEAAGVDRWVTTEKDAVRIRAAGGDLESWWAVRMEFELEDSERFNGLLEPIMETRKP
ncbi:MAG TPA: tetraacyldisaccharide 4'-kinase, partial [Nitrospiria bacterium]|nr:tetraacyldisaccharide 4'-kinase [Nitrospiria bacterium]